MVVHRKDLKNSRTMDSNFLQLETCTTGDSNGKVKLSSPCSTTNSPAQSAILHITPVIFLLPVCITSHPLRCLLMLFFPINIDLSISFARLLKRLTGIKHNMTTVLKRLNHWKEEDWFVSF